MELKSGTNARWDVMALGEVLLRFDPGEMRLAQTRSLAVCEGGGEYNVARGLSGCFGYRATVATALVENPVGQLVASLMRQGGVDLSHVLWSSEDGGARNGLYFLERGFGLRGALGCMDRRGTAISQLEPGMVDWDAIFGGEGVRWFHTGGIFCGLSEGSPGVAREAMESARRHGAVVSFDCNYRPSLWRGRGGRQAAARVNRALAGLVDVLFGHESDLALELDARSDRLPEHTAESYAAMAGRMLEAHPNLEVIATATRRVWSAGVNDFGGYAFAEGRLYEATGFQRMEVLDRVGSGDAFAAGVIHGLLGGKGVGWALECGVAHGALVMTTAGDSSYATVAEVEQLMRGADARVQR